MRVDGWRQGIGGTITWMCGWMDVWMDEAEKWMGVCMRGEWVGEGWVGGELRVDGEKRAGDGQVDGWERMCVWLDGWMR